ncbi:MAG: T9SS type A sorting domain-containing protein [Ignavibacteriaceae bacterium]|nr:T9SS type A sorting domain-containing protein [Ignavibacteriaceae bacterium]
MKKHLLLFMFFVLIIFGQVGWGQLYWRTDGTSGTWTGANWSNPASATGGIAWTDNTDAIFSANSTLTFVTGTSIGNVTVNDGITVTVTAAGTLSMNGSVRTFNIGTGSTLTWNSQTVTANSAAGITKSGSGTLSLGALTFTTNMNGGFTLNNGTVIVSGVKAFGNGGLTISGGTIQSSGSSAFTPTSITIGGDFMFTGTGNDVYGANVSLGAATRIITNSASGNRQFSGIISGNSGIGLTINGVGAGSIILSGANTYTGLTTVSGSILQLNRTGGTTLPVTNNATISGGTLQISSNQTLNNLDLASGATLIVDAGVTLTINGTFTNRGGTISGTGTIAYGASSTLEYAGASSQTTTTAEFPTSSGPNSLTINNAAGVIISNSVAVSGTLYMQTGNLAIGSSTLTINSTGIVYCNTSVISGAGTFTLSSGATLHIGSADGITSSGSTGNIQTTTRNFNSGASYYYDGGLVQHTGNGLPSTISAVLSVSQSYGLTLDASTTVATVDLANGKLTLGSNNLTCSDFPLNVSEGDYTRTTWVVTNGSGSLNYSIGASTSKVLPVGISTVYTPVTITNNNVSTDNFSALVSSDASGSNSGADRVKLLWTIGRAGSSNYTPAFTWPSSVEGATFSANRATYAQLYDVNNTSSSIASTLSGSDPYTVTANTFASSNTSYTIGNNAAALPVELTSFFALVQNKTVSLAWQTATEVNNYGFEIERTSSRPSPLQGEGGEAGRGWVKVGFVNGAGNSNSPKEYSFTDKTATSGLNVYRLKQIDNDGKYTYSKEVEVDLGMPTEFSLAQNYPNPFNPTTSLQYAVSSKQLVTIKVFDMLGREVAVLVNGEKEPGTYTAEFSTTGLASGTYLYRMQAGGFVQTKKMVVLK